MEAILNKSESMITVWDAFSCIQEQGIAHGGWITVLTKLIDDVWRSADYSHRPQQTLGLDWRYAQTTL